MWQDHDVEASLDVGETDEWGHYLSRPRHSNSQEGRTEDIPTRRAGRVPGSLQLAEPTHPRWRHHRRAGGRQRIATQNADAGARAGAAAFGGAEPRGQ